MNLLDATLLKEQFHVPYKALPKSIVENNSVEFFITSIGELYCRPKVALVNLYDPASDWTAQYSYYYGCWFVQGKKL